MPFKLSSHSHDGTMDQQATIIVATILRQSDSVLTPILNAPQLPPTLEEAKCFRGEVWWCVDPWQLEALCRGSHLHKYSPVVFHRLHHNTLEMRESCNGAERRQCVHSVRSAFVRILRIRQM